MILLAGLRVAAGQSLMRQYIYLILFALVLALPFGVRAMLLRTPAGATAATGERLVIVTPHNQVIRKEFARAFSDWHLAKYGTAVTIDYRIPGGANDVVRLLRNSYDQYRDPRTKRLPAEMPAAIDVVWGGGDYLFEYELKPQGILQSITIDPQIIREAFPESTLAGVKLLDGTVDKEGNPTPLWAGVCLSAFGIVYNPDLYRTINKPLKGDQKLLDPTTWNDLTTRRLSGLISLADPAHSGSAAVAFLMVQQRAMADAEENLFDEFPEMRHMSAGELQKDSLYRQTIAAGWKRGMAILLRIAANARYFTDSSNQVPNDVGNGQAAAGMAIDFYGRAFQEMVGADRCKVVLPAGATAITPDPVAILHGVRGRRLEIANHFVEFLLSRQGQLLWILKAGAPGGPLDRPLRRPPVRRDLYGDRANWTDDVNPFEQAHGFNQRAEWSALFSDTRMIWVAAWIDSRESLKGAYEKVLNVPSGVMRRNLLRRLDDLPVTMEDVQRQRRERQAAEKAGNADEWAARTRIEWGWKFRHHFSAIEHEAARRSKKLKVASAGGR